MAERETAPKPLRLEGSCAAGFKITLPYSGLAEFARVVKDCMERHEKYHKQLGKPCNTFGLGMESHPASSSVPGSLREIS